MKNVGSIKLISGKGKKYKSGSGSASGSRSGSTSGSSTSSSYRSSSGSSAGYSSGYSSGYRSGSGSSSGNRSASGTRNRSKRKTGAKTAFTIFVILLIGVAALVLSLGFYVKSLDTVFPNVWAEGIKLSGLTLDEAKQTLIGEGYEDNAANVFATVIFPDDSRFTISGEEVGLSLNADDAAKKAYEYGREGSFFKDELAYARSLLNRTDLNDLSKATLNEEFVRGVVTEHTKKFNDTLIENVCETSEDSIIVVKGTSVKPASEEAVFDLTIETLMRAMDERTHLTSEYIPEEDEIEEVDLGALYDSVKIDPVSSVYDPETVSASNSSPGLSFDLDAARTKLDNAQLGERIEIPLYSVEPEVTREQIESLLFRDVIASKTTDIAGTNNRLNNIVLSSQAINGTVLNPGDVFSFNGIVGQRTAAKGYKEAGAYVGGRVVQETGGGICQTSSTIYDCVLHTDLEVVERSAHRFTVSYLPYGNDATINWGSLDFKFRNNTDYPIRIEAVVTGRKLDVKLIGTKLDDTHIKTEYVTISTTPYNVIRQTDASVTKATVDTSGYNGVVVDTYKCYYDGNDKLIEKKLVGRSSYKTQDRIILVPPELAEGEQPTSPPADSTAPPTTETKPTDPPATTKPTPTDPPPSPPPEQTSPPDDSAPTDGAVDDFEEASRQEPEE